MLIVYERKRKEFVILFPTVDSFVEYLKVNYSSLKFDNKITTDKINQAYNFFITTDEVVQYTRLTRNLHRGFNFKHKNVTKKDFWIERGWSDKESDDIIQKDKSERAIKQSKKKKLQNKKKNVLILNGSENEFRFISGIFYSKNKPICNECNSDLILKRINVNNISDKFYYKITSCSSDDCKTHKMKKNNKYLSFLPSDVAAKTIGDIAKNIKEKNILSIDSWMLKGYPGKEAKENIFKIQSENSKKRINPFIPTKENLKKYGYSEEKIKEICLSPTQEEFWLKKGFSEVESKDKVRELQKSNSIKFAKKRKENPGAYSAITETQISYWINKGMSEEDAKQKIRERQTTFSKKTCVEKYGEEEGLKIFTKRQNRWLISLSTGGNLKKGYSKISQDLFSVLLENYDIDDRDGVYFATHNKEYKLNKCESEGGIWLYDFTDTKNKKIIEFHGDMFHGNPKKYKATDYPHPFRKTITAQEMWCKDKRKVDVAIEEGFEIMVIWDSEYRWGNKQEVINKCIAFIKKK